MMEVAVRYILFALFTLFIPFKVLYAIAIHSVRLG